MPFTVSHNHDKKNVSNRKGGITPYRLVVSVLAKLGMVVNQRVVRTECIFAKKLLDRLHSEGFDDVAITQMVDYTCQGMMREAAPRNFRYFYGILSNFLDRSATDAYGNVSDISQFIPKKEEDVDNPI